MRAAVPDPGRPEYDTGEVVSFCTDPDDPNTCHQYKSKVDGNLGNQPNTSPGQWQEYDGTPQGDAPPWLEHHVRSLPR